MTLEKAYESALCVKLEGYARTWLTALYAESISMYSLPCFVESQSDAVHSAEQRLEAHVYVCDFGALATAEDDRQRMIADADTVSGWPQQQRSTNLLAP